MKYFSEMRVRALFITLVLIIGIPIQLLEASSWSIVDNPYFRVYHRVGYTSDAVDILNKALAARDALQNFIGAVAPVKIDIYLYDGSTWGGGDRDVYTNLHEPSISLLAPSDSGISPAVRDRWYQYVLAREYARILLAYNLTVNGYRANVPEWFFHSFPEYLAVYGVSVNITDMWLSQNDDEVQELSRLVHLGDAMMFNVVGNPVWSVYVARYIHEWYGSGRALAIWSYLSNGTPFIESVKNALNITILGLEVNWLKWVSREFNVDENIYLEEISMYEGEYQRLLREYKELLGRYEELNRTYSDLVNAIDSDLSVILTGVIAILSMLTLLMGVLTVRRRS